MFTNSRWPVSSFPWTGKQKQEKIAMPRQFFGGMESGERFRAPVGGMPREGRVEARRESGAGGRLLRRVLDAEWAGAEGCIRA